MDAAIVGMFAFLISVAGAGRPSFWEDEAATISASTRSLSQLWSLLTTVDAVHGLYYLLMHGWFAVFPATEFWSRVPSAIAIGIAAGGVVTLGWRLSTRSVAVTAGIVFAVLPWTTWQSARQLVVMAVAPGRGNTQHGQPHGDGHYQPHYLAFTSPGLALAVEPLTSARPQAYAQLRDPGRLRAAVDGNTLYESRVPISSWAHRLDTCQAVWTISERDATVPNHERGSGLSPGPRLASTPAYQIIRDHGFQIIERWQFNLIQVVKSTK
jgi:uncharacterized membrane protein